MNHFSKPKKPQKAKKKAAYKYCQTKGALMKMRKKIILLSLVFVVFYLSSCSAILIKPEGPIGNVKYKINDEANDGKTVEILEQKGENKSLHWLYLSCDYIFGCYMRCEGQINSCIEVATLSNFDIKYIMTKKKNQSSQPRCHQYC